MADILSTVIEPARRNRIGLVLGAGGIRGCAHAGVISVLLDAQIPIDHVVGASVGAIFGFGLAAGVPVSTMARAAAELTPRDMAAFYAGRLRCSGRHPIGRLLQEAGEGKTFSDLALPFAVVVTEMTTGRPIVIDSGPVLPAIEASIAVPLIASPKRIDGTHYFDGGLYDTAPVHVARRMGADQVIAVCLGVNFTAPAFLRRRPWTRNLLTRLGTQRSLATGGLPDQLRFTCRLLAAGFEPPESGGDADIALWPQFGDISPNSIFGARICFEEGVACARDSLPAIREVVASVAPSNAVRTSGVRPPS